MSGKARGRGQGRRSRLLERVLRWSFPLRPSSLLLLFSSIDFYRYEVVVFSGVCPRRERPTVCSESGELGPASPVLDPPRRNGREHHPLAVPSRTPRQEGASPSHSMDQQRGRVQGESFSLLLFSSFIKSLTERGFSCSTRRRWPVSGVSGRRSRT